MAPSFSAGCDFSTTFDETSAPARRWNPRNTGSGTVTSGLSTWKWNSSSTPAAASSARRPEERRPPMTPAVAVGAPEQAAVGGEQQPPFGRERREHPLREEAHRGGAEPVPVRALEGPRVSSWFPRLVMISQGIAAP